jgi:2-methylcitrate dehydratase
MSVPIAEKKAVTAPDSIASQFVDYTQWLEFEKLTPESVHEAKRRIIDAFGCAMGAYVSAPAKVVRAVAQLVESPRYGASVLGTFQKTSPEMAAFANGLLIRYLDYNDTYLSKEPAHPSDNIAAVMALAEPVKSSGWDILTATILAYEVQCRLCDAASIRANGWDHVTYGAFSASLAASYILKLDKAQTHHALALAVTPNVTMRQTRVGELSHWKGAAFANASRNAVFAAQLAQHGMTGPSHIVEGEMGFQKQVSGPFSLPAALGGQQGQPYMINNTSIKYWPAEYHSQSAIDVALQLRAEIPVPSHITAIDIHTFHTAVDIIGGEEEKWFPKSRETADHSMPYCVAAALLDGQITATQFDEAHLNNPELSAMIQKIRMHRNEDLDKLYPEGIPNLLKVTLQSGQVLEKQVTYPRGHARNPMTDEEVNAKFKSLASHVLSNRQINTLLDQLWTLENQEDIGTVLQGFAV